MSENESDTSQPSPMWDHSDKHYWAHLLKVGYEEFKAVFLRFIVWRGNKVDYLRHLGVRIGRGCDILTSIKNFGTEPWLIELGDRVTVTSGVVFLTHDGANRVFRDQLSNSSIWGNLFGRIQIMDNCFIGVNAIIMPGVKIGPNCIVGAGSVVLKDVPPNSVVAGVPAKIISTLDDYIERYKNMMIPITAVDRRTLRQELTQRLNRSD